MDEHRKIRSIDDIETKEKSIEIPTEPCRAMCEVCRKEVTTYAKSEYSVWLWALVIFTLYFFGLKYGIFLLFLTIPLFKNVNHTCPYCFEILLVKNFYPIQIKEKYCWLQYGKCVIILRLVYIYIFLIFVFSFGFYINITYMFSEQPNNEIYSHDHTHEIDDTVKEYYSSSDLTWQDLIKDCGARVMIENSARANEIFNRKYIKKVIEWKGYFLTAFIQNRNPMDFNPDHLMNINVRMIPSESIQNPDLFLSLDYKKYNEYVHLIKTLSTGTPIKFKASLEALGNEWRSHHLHLIKIERTEDFIDHDQKTVLFQGIKFNITGHLKIEHEIEKLNSDVEQIETNKIKNNSTDENNNRTVNNINDTIN